MNNSIDGAAEPGDGTPLPPDVGADVMAHLWAIRQAGSERAMLSDALRASWAAGDVAAAQKLTGHLDALAEVTELEILAASSQLIALIGRSRWFEVRACREAGDSWDQIGNALGTSAADARSQYERAIEIRERANDGLHDHARSRAALGE